MSDFDEEKYSRIFIKEIDHSEVRYGLLIVTDYARFLPNSGLITIIDKKDNKKYFGTRDTTVDYETPRIYSTEDYENNIREFVKKYINIPGIDLKDLSPTQLKEAITSVVFKKYIKGDKFSFQFDLKDNSKVYVEYIKNIDNTRQPDIMEAFGMEEKREIIIRHIKTVTWSRYDRSMDIYEVLLDNKKMIVFERELLPTEVVDELIILKYTISSCIELYPNTRFPNIDQNLEKLEF